MARLSTLLADRPAEAVEDRPLAEVLGQAREYFKSRHGSVIYPDELARSLRTSVHLAIEVCRALSNEGQIAEVR